MTRLACLLLLAFVGSAPAAAAPTRKPRPPRDVAAAVDAAFDASWGARM